MAKLPSSIPAVKLLDNLLSKSPLRSHEFIEAFATLIVLRWADFQEAEQEAIAAFDDTNYEPVLPASLHWRTWHQLPMGELWPFLTEQLSSALHRLNNSRHNPLATHLHRLAHPLQKMSDLPIPSVPSLVQWLAEQPFETPHDRRQLLYAFDEILEASPDKSDSKFKTPPQIAGLMVALAAPAKGESIYDPCFGAGELLTSAIDFAMQSSEQGKAWFNQAVLQVSGIELNESAYIVGLTRLVLAGCDDPQLEYGNSLERSVPTNPSQEGFNVVVANPPWGWTTKLGVRYDLEHYPVMTKDSTGLFIQHALSSLRPNGRAVIAVPQGILFRRGAERRLREWLIGHHTVEAVISLPETAFLPFTAIKSSILVLRRGGTTKQIRMMDAGPYFQKGKGRQPATISESSICKLVENIRAAKPSESCWDIDVETLTKTDFDLTPRRRDQSGLNEIFDSLGQSVVVARLKDCCREILLGRQIPSAALDDKLPKPPKPSSQQQFFNDIEVETRHQGLIAPVESIPYIRIKDIKKGQINKSSTWITAKAILGKDSYWKLRAGDVLLSKSSTIGKVGVVRNGAVGAVAANGLYVLRTDGDRLDPHYLAAYLDTADCRAWLQDRASGGSISHLTKRILEDLPVPLPPLQLQQQVAAMWREHGEDALSCLAQLLSEEKQDPFKKWLQKILKELPDDSSWHFDSKAIYKWEKIANDFKAIKDTTKDNLWVKWISAFDESVTPLRKLSNVPEGPGLFSILRESSNRLSQAEDILKSWSVPSKNKANDLTHYLATWLTEYSSTLLNKVKIVLSSDLTALKCGVQEDISLQIENKGPLPIREIRIITQPDWGQGAIDYLPEHGTAKIVLHVATPEWEGPLPLNIYWSGITLDGNKVEGSQEIPFEILSEKTEEKNARMDIGASPYVCGDPIRPERNDVFFGREELLDQIRRQIVQSGNVVLLEGNRRAGKSSILRHLEGVGPVPGWLGVYCSLQGAEGSQTGVGVPTAAIFREIAISIAKGMINLGIEVPLPDGSIMPPGKKIGIAKACRNGISDDHPFADFRDYAETALEAVAEKQLGILMMLDEFDKLQDGIDNGVTSPQVPENIRFLVQTYPGFSAILTGSRRLKRLREEYWSTLFGLGTRFGVTSLSTESAKRLVTEPVKGRLVYSREAVERAIMLTNRQPFLLQSLCNRIFDMAAQLKIRSISLDVVEEAATLLADDNEHFRSLWEHAETDQRRFILGLIHNETAGSDLLRFGLLRELLSTHGIEVDEEELSSDLDFLRELELVDLVGESGSGHYTLAIPLMGKWIGQQNDFEVLRNKARSETEDYHG
jgi:type I restriction enzyme M protein